MQVYSTQMIQRSAETVWQAFVNPKTWRYWFGEALVEVRPSWDRGSQLIWKNGSVGCLEEFEPFRRVGIRNPGGDYACWDFSPQEGKTVVSLHCDYSRAIHPLADGDLAASFWSVRLEAFKHFVELR